jgi:dihydroorotase
MQHLSIIKPDDMHCHFRDDDCLSRTVPDTAHRFQRAIVMPNLKKPIVTVADALAYRKRILAHVPKGLDFRPLMTLYLTESMSPTTISEAQKTGEIPAAKLYPQGATTHSEFGVSSLEKIYPLFEAMEKSGMLLLIHGESIDPKDDIFEREKIFIEKNLTTLLQKFPALKIVLEHISTEFAVDFVKNSPDNLAATITPHHLLLNRNDLFRGGLHPHYFCLPILKKSRDQAALIKAATSGHKKFFLGTDSAPHAKMQKESACGCAGIYSAHIALELYAQIFAHENALEHLEKFASQNGADFYHLPYNTERITLAHQPTPVQSELSFGSHTLVPLCAGENVDWSIHAR